MRTIEATADVTDDHRLSLNVMLPADIPAGTLRILLVIDEPPLPTAADTLDDFPVIDVGPWPNDLSLRREDLYGDNGR